MKESLLTSSTRISICPSAYLVITTENLSCEIRNEHVGKCTTTVLSLTAKEYKKFSFTFSAGHLNLRHTFYSSFLGCSRKTGALKLSNISRTFKAPALNMLVFNKLVYSCTMQHFPAAAISFDIWKLIHYTEDYKNNLFGVNSLLFCSFHSHLQDGPQRCIHF